MLSSALGEVTMDRRQFLKLGAVAGGVFSLGSTVGTGRQVAAQGAAIPTVDRLVLTNVVDNVYDIFARGGKLDTITVQRAAFARSGDTLLSEHGLAYHLESMRGAERREILLDFALTELNLSNNYRALKLDPSRADALILSHGHVDHYGALAPLVEKGVIRRGLTLYAGGEDTFCRRVVATPAGNTDMGQLDQPGLEARGLKVVLAKQPTVVAGHAFTTGQIERLTDFEKPPAVGRLVVGPMDSACAVSHFGVTQVAAK